MNDENIIDIEIAIIGAGPAGIAASIGLSKLGHRDLIVFEREDEAGGMPRHCGHLGFGIFEFQRLLSGPDYSRKLAKKAEDYQINIQLSSTLAKIDGDILVFSTPNGIQYYRAKRTILALGAREVPRPSQLVSGTRSPNIITTGALQRFVYLQERAPFKKAVIVGSEIVSFSALMTARHAGIEIVAIVEAKDKIDSFGILKPFAKYILKTPVHTSTRIAQINGENKEISSVTISKDGAEETIECNGVIFSGNFTPESTIMKKSFDEFNMHNNSVFVSQNFQTSKKEFFAAGNVLRGVLAAFKCYFEGKKVASKVHASLLVKKEPTYIQIEADEAIEWYYPSLIDVDAAKKELTTLRFKGRKKGLLRVMLNDKQVLQQNINSLPFRSITVDWFGIDVKESDSVKMLFDQA